MLNPDDIRQKLIACALPQVSEKGWTPELMKQCEEKLGMEKGTAAIVFPCGSVDTIDAFALWADKAMLDGLNQSPFATMGTTERVTTAVRKRLEALSPYKEAERAAIGVLACPSHIRRGMKIVWRTSDTIWTTCGDTSTDYNRYTKRMLLSSVLKKTTLYWLADDSKDHKDSWDFLDRQIAMVLKIGKTVGSFKKPFDTVWPFLGRFGDHAKKRGRS